jgi:extradiol dioxygenase family protein
MLLSMTNSAIFHLAIPIEDIAQAKAFYCGGLGCELGRESENAIILNFYGHQVVAHRTEDTQPVQKGIYPRHFGLVFLELPPWKSLLERAKLKELPFYIEPKTRFSGLVTEHRSFFLEDPFHNLLEFKFYSHAEAIFGSREITTIGDRP